MEAVMSSTKWSAPVIAHHSSRITHHSRAFTLAELLAWSLVGADQLGTPGFKNVNGKTEDPDKNDDSFFGGWTDDTTRYFGTNNAPSGLYALDANQQPVFHRGGAFVDLARMKLP